VEIQSQLSRKHTKLIPKAAAAFRELHRGHVYNRQGSDSPASIPRIARRAPAARAWQCRWLERP